MICKKYFAAVFAFLFSFAEYPAACCGDVRPSQPKLLRRSRQGEENNPSPSSVAVAQLLRRTGEARRRRAKEGIRLWKNSARYRAALLRGASFFLLLAGFAGSVQAGIFKSGSLVPNFGKNGGIDFPVGSFYKISIDSRYMYIAGSERTSSMTDPDYTARQHRNFIEKRLLTTGAFAPEFGVGGVLDVKEPVLLMALAADKGFMYLVTLMQIHNSTSSQTDIKYTRRIERRLLSTGAPDPVFGNSGSIIIEKGEGDIRAMAIDENYMYLAGRFWTPGEDFIYNVPQEVPKVWHMADFYIEKRLLATGALVPEFGVGGVVKGEFWSGEVRDIKIDSQYMYLAGSDAGNIDGQEYPSAREFRLEKRLLSTGALVPGFGENGVQYGPKYAGVLGFAIDDYYIYTAGLNLGANEKLQWHIEKRLLSTGALDANFGKDGIVEEFLGYAGMSDIAVKNGYLYLLGGGRTSDGLLQRRFASSGALDTTFGQNGSVTQDQNPDLWNSLVPSREMVFDAEALYLVGGHSDISGRLEKRFIAEKNIPGLTPSFSSSRILRKGMRGNDVSELQSFLGQFPNIYPEKLVTGYFGPLTEAAVQRFQAKYNIVNSGDAASTGYGQVGSKTRAKLNELFEKKEGPG